MLCLNYFYQIRQPTDEDDKIRKVEIHLTSAFIKAAPIVIVLIQIAVFTILVLYYYQEYDQGWCPQSTAPLYGRITSSIVSLYYVIHLWLYFAESKKHWHTLEVVKRAIKPEDPVFKRVQFDAMFMNFIFDSIVYVVNLWLIGLTDSPLDMVLNSVALEFITQMDSEAKRKLFDVHPEIKEDIKYYFLNGGKVNSKVNENKKTAKILPARTKEDPVKDVKKKENL
jgi:hypothetical protein